MNKLNNVINKISDRYWGGNFKEYRDDIRQETIAMYLESSEYNFETLDVFRAVSKAFYKIISEYGYSKKLGKESTIANGFYLIESLGMEDFNNLQKIETLYKNGNYYSIIKEFNLNLNKQEEKKLRKFLSIVFPKKKK